MRKIYLLILAITLSQVQISGQKSIEGKITDALDKEEMGLPGANIIWAGTTTGTSTKCSQGILS